MVEFKCSIHNYKYIQSVQSHIILSSGSKNHGCFLCGREQSLSKMSEGRVYPDWFIDDLVHDKDKLSALCGTLSSTNYVDFKCKYNHVYTQQVKNHIVLSRQERYKGCPICFPNRSKPEIDLETFVKSFGLSTEHRRFSYGDLHNFEVDIFIPSLNIGIEYNGSYYHRTLPISDRSKNKTYHQDKFLACKCIGIRLISIFDVDWLERQDKVKSYLSTLFMTYKNKIYARKTSIARISKVTSNDMYEKYHLLGSTPVQDVSYGLFYNNELVSCMSFQLGRYKEENKPIWCLTRFVTKYGLLVVGGASKLLKQFEREFKPSVLVSFSDNDYFSGGVYDKLGFECKGCTKSPRYFWNLNTKEIKREQCQLKKLSKKYPDLYKESLSISGNKEDYIMLKLGAFKVYRSGHTKWIKKYN